MKITTRQYNFFDNPARLYYITSSSLGSRLTACMPISVTVQP